MQVVEHIAAYLGLDGTLVRERNFMRPNTLPPQYPVLKDNTNSSHSTPAQQKHSTPAQQAQHAKHAQQSGPDSNGPDTSVSSSNGLKQNVQSMGEQENLARQNLEDPRREVLCGRYLPKKSKEETQSQDAPAGRYRPCSSALLLSGLWQIGEPSQYEVQGHPRNHRQLLRLQIL